MKGRGGGTGGGIRKQFRLLVQEKSSKLVNPQNDTDTTGKKAALKKKTRKGEGRWA